MESTRRLILLDLLNHAGRAVAAHRLIARQFFDPVLRRPVTRRGARLPILFYSQVPWDAVWQRPQEQALGLSRHRPVVFVGPVQPHDLTHRLVGKWSFARSLNKGRLLVLSPLIFSGEYKSAPIRRINRRIISHLLRSVLRDDRFIFLTNSPFSGYLVEDLIPRFVVYDLIDDFCSFNWAPPEGRDQEDLIIKAADVGFAGTGFLREKFAARFSELDFLSSGVRFDRLTEPCAEPADLSALPRPRLLYVGTLNDRLDGALFDALARAIPGGSVVVVGPRHNTFTCPALPPNVHFLGLKAHEALPGYYQHCDLGIMPFADNEAARAINPVKTLEYLACGLPVLSTPVPDVIRYYPEVVRVEKPADWPRAARELLEQDNEGERARRRDFARGRSWDSVVRAMEARLRRLESGRP